MENKYTHGGLPAETAKHWCSETYQELGDILFKLLTGNTENRRKAVCKYFELKRHFMKEEFEEYIALLDAHRINKGALSFSDLVDKAIKEYSFSEQLLRVDPNAVNEPVPKIEVISLKNHDKNILSSLRGKEIVVEQLSLF